MVKTWAPAALCVALLGALLGCGRPASNLYQGYIEGEFVQVSAPLAGRLVKLEVQRGAEVAAGAALFSLDSDSELAAVREAEARLAKAQAQAENLTKGKRSQELAVIVSQLDQARTQLSLSESQLTRSEQMRAKGFITAEALDQARTTRNRDAGRVKELEAQLQTAELAARTDEISASQAEIAASEAALAQARWRLAQKTISAPVAGTVFDTFYDAGEWVAAGAPVVSMLPPQQVKVRFYVPESALGALRVGMAATITCDGCAAPIAATVGFIAPEAEFTPPVIYSKERRSKLVFLIEAKVAPADAARLHPGQPVDVELAPT